VKIFIEITTSVPRARKEYWENLCPCTGRPYSASLSKPDDWGVSRGDALLKQHKESTTDEEMKLVLSRNGN
jgi:betaine-homocysteine S-methyltransferase